MALWKAVLVVRGNAVVCLRFPAPGATGRTLDRVGAG
jgi:hypothetical protein